MDINDHPHFALLQSESYVSPREMQWYAWVRAVELRLGHDLDGNQDLEGYSLDYAHDAFEGGDTPEQYVANVKRAKTSAAVDVAAFTRSYGGGRHQIEICPNHSGLLFWRARTVGPFETSSQPFGVWSQWMPIAEARNYEHAFKIATHRLAQAT